MSRRASLKHKFVEYIPPAVEDGTLYISIAYLTAVHRCCCGCGHDVVTPLGPTHWTLIFDGETVSLDPSIGNWNLECKSHYWIRRNRLHWAERWTAREIAHARRRDAQRTVAHFSGESPEDQRSHAERGGDQRKPLWTRRAWEWLRHG